MSSSQMGVDRFISNVKEGLASPNRYTVEFSNPANGKRDDPSISIMCNVAQLPGRNIKSYTNNHYYSPKLPLENEFQPITFSFISQIGFPERKWFEAWQKQVIEPDTDMIHFHDDFSGSIIISHLNHETGKPDYKIRLWEAWPLSIGEVGMGYSMTNETMIQSVTFTYWYWETLTLA